MTCSNRRCFLIRVAAAAPALVVTTRTLAQSPPARLDEKDPQAVALGYVNDTTKVDNKKYPKHSNDQKCGVCQLYQGKPGDATGPCPIFAGKHVAANGWCSSFIKKAG